MKHLTDSQIQENLTGAVPEHRAHLRACAECREQLEHYALLQKMIVEQPALALPATFKASLMARVSAVNNRQTNWENLLVGLLFIVGAAAIFYFFRPIKFPALFNWFNPDSFSAVFKPFRSWPNLNYLYLSVAGIILVVYHFVDRAISHTRLLRH